MATTFKILGQAQPALQTYYDIYTVPAGNSTIVSTINVCNTATSNATFRVYARIAGAAGNTTAQAIVFDAPVPAQDALGLSLGITLNASDKLTVYSFTGNVTYTLFGSEVY